MGAKLYLPLGDRIELMKVAAEFAPVNQMKPIQFFNAMAAAVAEEPEPEVKQ
ncbi:MAG: hypothetical protein ACLQBD_26680 [Syntrophobacteraceae bacterium]